MNNFTQVLARGMLMLLWLFSYSSAFTQNGQYDVRFNTTNFDCTANELLINVEISATSPATEFLLTNQNYRFSYNRSAVTAIPTIIGNGNPTGAGEPVSIESELDVSGFTFVDGYTSFFSAHTIVGSMDTVISYNVAMAAGAGYPVKYGEWVRVGSLRFQITDADQDLNLSFHPKDPTQFPNTFIGGNTESQIGYEVDEGNYFDLTTNLNSYCSATLPIELSYFEGTDKGCSILLEWQTITESNSAYFEIEKSQDGQSFETIGRVEAAGNSIEVRDYDFIDERVGLLNYYQLRQVDHDGTSIVSEHITVKSTCFENGLESAITSIHPNPVGNEKATLQFYTDQPPGEASIKVTDISGRLRIVEIVDFVKGPNIFTIDPTALESGVYMIKLVGADWYSAPQKFIKIK